MYATKRTSRKARIATAIVLAALALAVPTAAAEEGTPEVHEDGSVSWGDCVWLNPNTIPPGWGVSVRDCVPP